MNIALWHNLPSGGGKRALNDQVAGLLSRGHRVTCWCPPTADRSYMPLSDLGVEERVLPLTGPREGDALKGGAFRRVGRLVSAAASLEADLAAAMDAHSREVAAEIHAGGFDLLLAHPCRTYAAAWVGRHVLLPKALYLQEPYRQSHEAAPDLPWLSAPAPAPGRSKPTLRAALGHAAAVREKRERARHEVANARAFDVVLVNSLFSRESLLRLYGLDARVCRLGVSTERFVDQMLPRESLVVGMGAIYPHKNVMLAVRSVAAMPPPRPKLVWVGNLAVPLYVEELRAAAAAGGVEFETRVMASDEQIVELLNRAGVMAYAPRLEPFGYAPLEAGACGLAVVAVAEGGVRETVTDGENGLLVEHDPAAMAQGLGRVLGDPALARRLGEGGKALVRGEFSLDAAAERLERRLLDLLRHAPADRRPGRRVT